MRRRGIVGVAGAVAAVGLCAGGLLAARPPARTDALVATIATASGFPSLTLAPGNRALLTDPVGGRVQVVDTTTGRVIGTLATGRPILGPWVPSSVDGRLHRAFVSWPAPPRAGGGTVTIAAIDLTSGRLLGSVTLSPPPLSFMMNTYLAADARRHRLFVLSSRAPMSSLLTLDTTHLRLLRTVALSAWRGGGGSWGLDGPPLAVDEATGRVFAGRIDEEAVAVLDATSGRLLRTVALPPAAPVPGGPYVQVACPLIDPDRARVYIPNPAARTFTILDARTGGIVRAVHLAFQPARPIVDAAGRVFLPSQSQDGYALIDARSGRLLRTHAPGGAPAVVAVALDEGRQRVFVADNTGGTVAVDDLRTGRTLRTVGVGLHLSGLVFDRRRDRVLVTNAGPCCANGQYTGNGSLVVLDGANGRVLRTIPLGRGPQQPLLDEAGGRVLVVNAGGGTVTDPDPWGWVPGPIRQRVSFLPPPRPRLVAGSVMVFDLARVTQG